jgi:hypothetical protein
MALEKVKSFVNDKAVDPAHSCRYLIFGDLQKGATIRLEFPNPETTDGYSIAGTRYQVTFRGSTIVDIEPRAEQAMLRDWYNGIRMPLYQRSHFKAGQTPMHTVRRFVADKVLALQ